MIISLKIKGAVQGVGYRPFIAQKANEYGLKGMVKNIGAAVEILVSGDDDKLSKFVDTVKNEYPAGAFILNIQKEIVSEDDSFPYDSFVIEDSSPVELTDELAVFSPDIGICEDCMKEMLDPSDRRYRYPLISCASCGPRISIANRFPYDRDTTTMIDFDMCPSCQKEYTTGRRRHAQTISCHDCGPQMILYHYEPHNNELCHLEKDDAVNKAIEIIMSGGIIGLKGISGYQLVCLPDHNSAKRLREIKGRENKPFAIMFGSLDTIKDYAIVTSLEEKLLVSSVRPIVLLEKKKNFDAEVVKDSDHIGAFLPSAGIHKLLCDAAGPLIVTSANKSDRPMEISDRGFKDIFMPGDCADFNTQFHVDGMLYHKRKINMAQDDSVMFVIKHADGSEEAHFVRRARGYAPLPVLVDDINNDINILALGGDLKSAFSFAKKDKIMPSQYIGDLEDYTVFENYKAYLDRFEELFEFKPRVIVRDMHPLYVSHNFASKRAVHYADDKSSHSSPDILDVQHHHAHALSVMAENSIRSCIGVCFDGTGYGTDGKIWGGEFILCKDTDFTRSGHLSYVKLCGGDKASKNAGLVSGCYKEMLGIDALGALEKAALLNDINTFETSSMGRLFDAVSATLGTKK